MLNGITVLHNARAIGHIAFNSVRVGSDGFYGNLFLEDSYEHSRIYFKDLTWNGMPCDGDRVVIESISRLIIKTRP